MWASRMKVWGRLEATGRRAGRRVEEAAGERAERRAGEVAVAGRCSGEVFSVGSWAARVGGHRYRELRGARVRSPV